MSSDEMWPFTDVRTVESRGDLLVLEGTAPDGAPVTITRLAPSAATDPAVYRRFHEAVEQARASTGPADPRVAWWDTATLSPWAATYPDPDHRGADRIAELLEPQPAAPGHAVDPDAEVPEPAGQPAPSFVQRRLPLVVSAVAGVVVLALALGIGGVVLRDQSSAGPSPQPTSRFTLGSVPPSGTDNPFRTGAPPTPATSRPTLRNVEPKSVYGPTWKPGDRTRTVRLVGVDYAFRAPEDFDCFLLGTTSETSQMRCLKLAPDPGKTRKLMVVNRSCAGDRCDAAQRRLFESVLAGGVNVVWHRKDRTTRFAIERVVDRKDGEKYFRFYLSHVYPDEHGERTRHVGILGEAPVGKHAKQIQKTVNDIRTQSG